MPTITNQISREDLIKASKLPPNNAIAYFESLGFRPHAGSWEEVLTQAKKQAFSIANINDARITESIYDVLRESLKTGQTKESTLQAIEATLVKKGFKSNVIPAYRMKQVYRANMFNSYNVGRFIAQKANQATQPYLQRVVVKDGGTRTTHEVAALMIYPANHPYWNDNYPPYLNGKYQFGCRCRVRSLSQRRVEAMAKQNPNLKIVWQTPEGAETSMSENPLYNLDESNAQAINTITDPDIKRVLIDRINKGYEP